MVMLMVEIDQKLMERLQAKAVAEDKPLEAVVIASLEKSAESELDLATDTTGRAFLLELAKLGEHFKPLIDRDDISENFDEVMDQLLEEDLRQKEEERER